MILDSIYDIHTTCEAVKQFTLLRSRRKILPNVENALVEFTEEEEISAHDLENLDKSVTGGKKVNERNVEEWFNCDTNDSGFGCLIDEQIAGLVLEPVSKDSEKKEKEGGKIQQRMSHDAALTHADGLIKYLKEKVDVSLCDKMLIKKLQSKI